MQYRKLLNCIHIHNRADNKMSVSDILKLNEIPKASTYVELKKHTVENE